MPIPYPDAPDDPEYEAWLATHPMQPVIDNRSPELPQFGGGQDPSWDEFIANRGQLGPAAVNIKDPATGMSATQTGGAGSNAAYNQYAVNKAGVSDQRGYQGDQAQGHGTVPYHDALSGPQANQAPQALSSDFRVDPNTGAPVAPIPKRTYGDVFGDKSAATEIPTAEPGKMSFTPNSPITDRMDKFKSSQDKNLMDARNDAEFQKFIARIGEGGEDIARAYSPFKVDRSYYSEMVKDAETMPADILREGQQQLEMMRPQNEIDLQNQKAQQAVELQNSKNANDLKEAEIRAKGDAGLSGKLAILGQQHVYDMEKQHDKQEHDDKHPKPQNQKITDAQTKAAGFYKNAMAANKDLEDVINSGYKPNAAANFFGNNFVKDLPGIGGMVVDQNDRKFIQAGKNWIENVLRPATGASFNVTEYPYYIATYIPGPNDGPDVLRQKKAARDLKMQTLKDQAAKNISTGDYPVSQPSGGGKSLNGNAPPFDPSKPFNKVGS